MHPHLLALTVSGALLGFGCGADDDDDQPPGTADSSAATGSTGTPGTGSSSANAGESGEETGEHPVEASSGGEPPQADPCAPGDRPSIEVGHGELEFEPFDAHPAELVYGVQGGYHITVGVRGVYTDNTDVSVLRMTGFIDGEELAFSAPYVELRCIEERQEATNMLLIWDTTPDVLHGKTALVRAELTDAAGAVHVAEGEVVIDDPTMD